MFCTYSLKVRIVLLRSQEKLNMVHNEKFITISTVQKLFERIKIGAGNMEDLPRFGRPVQFDDESVKSLVVGAKPQLTADEVAEKFNSFHGTIHRHLHAIGKVSKLGKWVPHELSEKNRQYRIKVFTSLFSRQCQCPFLDRIITGDEKWMLCHTITRKR